MQKPELLKKIRYKVLVLPDLTSTGLLHSTIIKYRPWRWNYPAEPPRRGKEGPGGLWVSTTKSNAKQLQKYLWEHHRKRTAIYLCIIDEVLFESSYRIKTNRLFLLDPIQI